MPASTPSRDASSRAVSIASSSPTGTTSSISSRFRTSGMNPAPMPWILCGPGRLPDKTAEARGSTATKRQRGFPCLSTSPAPVIVPPVPTPVTNTSTRPSSASQISGPVVRRWISGLAGFENWSGRKTSSREAIACAASTASLMPPSDSVSSTRAPYSRSSPSRSRLIPSGRVRTSSYPFAAHTNASAIPVLPLVASTIVVRPGSIRPSHSAASIIDTPIRSLTLPPGLKASSLANSSTSRSPAIRLSASIGVRPTSSEISIGIRGNSPGNPTESGGRDGARARRAARLGQPRLPTSACATGPAEVPEVLESTHGAAVIDPIDRLGRIGSRPASSTEGGSHG